MRGVEGQLWPWGQVPRPCPFSGSSPSSVTQGLHDSGGFHSSQCSGLRTSSAFGPRTSVPWVKDTPRWSWGAGGPLNSHRASTNSSSPLPPPSHQEPHQLQKPNYSQFGLFPGCFSGEDVPSHFHFHMGGAGVGREGMGQWLPWGGEGRVKQNSPLGRLSLKVAGYKGRVSQAPLGAAGQEKGGATCGSKARWG